MDGILLKTKILPNSIIYSWGWASHGKLGLGEPSILQENHDFMIACPQKQTADFRRIINNASHRRVMNSELDYLNQLYTYVPQIIMSTYGTSFKSISCGKNHSAALSTNGKVYLWGDNTFCQLSNSISEKSNEGGKYLENGTPSKRLRPPVKKNSTIKQLSFPENGYVSVPKIHPKFGHYNFIESKKIICNEYSTNVLWNIKI